MINTYFHEIYEPTFRMDVDKILFGYYETAQPSQNDNKYRTYPHNLYMSDIWKKDYDEWLKSKKEIELKSEYNEELKSLIKQKMSNEGYGYTDDYFDECFITEGYSAEFLKSRIILQENFAILLPKDEKLDSSVFDLVKEDLKLNIQNLQKLCIFLSQKAVWHSDNNEPDFECECGFKGPGTLLEGGHQIADTGDYVDSYCPVCNAIID